MSQFECLYDEYRQDVFRFLFRLTGYQRQLAEEMMQETFYQAMISFHRYRGECQIKTWLCQIAKNIYFNTIRKDKKVRLVSHEEYVDHAALAFDSVATDYETKELIDHAIKVIIQLDDTTRDVLIYRIFSELTYAQISALLKINESSAKVIFMRGKCKLQNKLREEYGYEI
ncbi:RNA polymerase sigma factor [Gorillibacterium timonense]|uniref:RNA polymerase sigma factor n=1 Tax=Gorillibacterium timonense TaxID=1689269 RepID=UPI00071DE74A|nr:sigma-70 family RNA polymerase sigma factor [Gorillibacterium timonense]